MITLGAATLHITKRPNRACSSRAMMARRRAADNGRSRTPERQRFPQLAVRPGQFDAQRSLDDVLLASNRRCGYVRSVGTLDVHRPAEVRARGRAAETRRLPSTRKGAIVARKRPTVSDVSQIPADLEASRPARGRPDGVDGLSHAQVRALRRCTPLTSAEFKAHRQVRASYDEPRPMELASRAGVSAKGRTGLGVRLRGEANRVDG